TATYTFSTSPFTIGGTVTSFKGAAIAGANVTAQLGGGFHSATTDANGVFTIQGLAPGTYALSVSKSGFVFPSGITATVGPSQTGVSITATAPQTSERRK